MTFLCSAVFLALVACSSEGSALGAAAGADEASGAAASGPLDFAAGEFRLVERTEGTPRSHHTATPLHDGTILLAGGFDGERILADAALFDPRTRTITPVESMAEARAYHTATLVAGLDGRLGSEDDVVVIAGGYNGEVLRSVEVFDPRDRTFTTIERAPLLQPLHRHGAVRVPGPFDEHGERIRPYPTGNLVLIAGGATFAPGEYRLLPTNAAYLYVYDPRDPNASMCWAAATPAFARVGHTLTAFRGPRGSVGSMALVFGGEGLDTHGEGYYEGTWAEDAYGVLGHPEVYDVMRDRWVRLGDEGASGPGVPRTGHAAIHVPSTNGVLIVGGYARDAAGRWETVPTEVFLPELSSIDASLFEAVPDLGVRRQSPTLTLLPADPERGTSRDEVLITGGYDLVSDEILSTAEIYVPDTGAGQVLPAPSMHDPRVYHSATFSHGPDGKIRTGDDEVLVVGGSRRAGGHLAPLPTSEVLEPRPHTTIR